MEKANIQSKVPPRCYLLSWCDCTKGNDDSVFYGAVVISKMG